MIATSDLLSQFEDEITTSNRLPYLQIQNPPNLPLAQIKKFGAPWGWFIPSEQAELADFHATDRLEHEQRMARLEEIQGDVARAQLGLTRLLAGLDEDRPTVLRKLNSIENKVDRLLDRTSE